MTSAPKSDMEGGLLIIKISSFGFNCLRMKDETSPPRVFLRKADAYTKVVTREAIDRRRILLISLIAVLIGACASIIAKALVLLIDLITNFSFYGRFSWQHHDPSVVYLGWWVVLVPVLGGIVVGLMAYYGSAAIRGHGIPEAMEQVLTNQSRIKPTITYLKPIASAIAIGTGGPFGAEGPIIATGGALGSTGGQLLRITHNERKILLAAGATAGMSAIFDSPVAAIFLAIELLLFEFSPRSIIPVSLACITGAAGHHLFFQSGPVFHTDALVTMPSNTALGIYSLMGIVLGLLSVGTTKIVYLIEDLFEKIPVHWMWWPAIGGIAVGVIGFYFPRTLGVGYGNITDILGGHLAFNTLLMLGVLKFLSWALALGSGTSGGTLAPLFTVGGAAGALLGVAAIHFFPSAGVTIPLSALVGMSALFAGASRAFLTSIIFAVETTAQPYALLPLLATSGASYFVSLFLMRTTIMTEKISRRGIQTPDSYESDLMERLTVRDVMNAQMPIISSNQSVTDAIGYLSNFDLQHARHFVMVNEEGAYLGIGTNADLVAMPPEASIGKLRLVNSKVVPETTNLRTAVEMMAADGSEALGVCTAENQLTGIITVHNVLSVYGRGMEEHRMTKPHLSFRRGLSRILPR